MMKYKRINNLEQYTQYCDEFEKLILENSKENKDEIDLLEFLIEDFDNKTIDLIGTTEDLNPVELLKSLLKDNDLTKAELARQLKVSKQLVTEIVNYKRNISKKMVMKLADRFKMMPIAFSREYDLLTDRRKKHLEMSSKD